MPMKTDESNGFARQIGAILDNLLSNEGFVLPIYAVTVSRNGAIMAGRYLASGDDSVTYETLAEYLPGKDGGILRPPVNCLFIDSGSGRPARSPLRRYHPIPDRPRSRPTGHR
jgi:hypothetical protein